MKRQLSSLLVLSIFAVALCAPRASFVSVIDGPDHQYAPTWSNGWSLTWRYNNTHLQFTVSGTSEWVGLGFNNENGLMQGADLTFAYIDGNGTAVLLDQYGVGEQSPVDDTDGGGSYDLTLLHGSKDNGTISFTFLRKWYTGDARDAQISPTPTNILWAQGPLSSNKKRFGFHTYYGTDLIQLVNYTTSTSSTSSQQVWTSSTTEAWPTSGSTFSWSDPSSTSRTSQTWSIASSTSVPEPTRYSNGFQNKFFALDWTVEGDQITFTMTSHIGGWVGIGLNRQPDMSGADMMVGWMSTYFNLLDQHALGHQPPVNDASNDLRAQTAVSAVNQTTITFSRNLNTGDSGDYVITSDPVYVLWAVGPAPQEGSQIYRYHSQRGVQQLRLFPQTNPVTVSQSARPVTGSITEGPFSLKWAISDDIITFVMSSSAGGWVAIGLNQMDVMNGADMIVGWVNEDQRATVLDQFSSGHQPPADDASNDIRLLSAGRHGNETTITVTRKLNTGDSNDYVITREPLYLLWAVGTQPREGSKSYSRHTQRGSKRLSLFS